MDFHEAYTDTCSTVGIAARLGNLEALKQLLENGKPADVKDNRGWFPIHEAAHAGHTACLDLLLKQEDVDIDWQTFEGETALLLACRKGRAACVEKLIENGANIDLPTNELVTPLHEACRPENIDCVRLLLEAGCDLNCHDYTEDTPLHRAVQSNCPEIVKLLLQYKADVCSYSEDELTPVFDAAQQGYLECLKLLLEEAKQQGQQFVVNMTAADNASPLLIACQNGHDECVELLLDSGADPGLQVLVGSIEESSGTHSYMDPLQYATSSNHKRCLQLLLRRPKKHPQLYKRNQFHPLRLAIVHKDTDCLKLLVENGFKIDQTFYDFYDSEKGFGCLLCFSPSLQAAEYILGQGLDLNKELKPENPHVKNRLNPVAESFFDEKSINLLNLLLKHGARMEESDKCWTNVVSYRGDKLWTNPCEVMLSLYLIIRYGCQTRKCLQAMQKTFLRHPWYDYRNEGIIRNYFGIISMLMLVTPNIKIQMKLVNEQGYPEAAQILQQIEADSHTLKYACRVAVVRHMITLDQWDSERLARLGVPEIIQDYLNFMEYGVIGEKVRRLVQAGKDYLNGTSIEWWNS